MNRENSRTNSFQTENMTVRTRGRYDLARADLTLAEAERELRENACVRSVREILAKAAGLAEDDAALPARITEKLAQVNPKTSRDSIRRKVSNWMRRPLRAVSKQSAIQLAFAFCSSPEQADSLIVLLCGERIHWRDPEELVFGFALNTGRSYQEAVLLYDRWKAKGIFNFPDQDQESFTQDVEYDILHISSPEELETYLTEHQKALGRFHNTARAAIEEFLQFLKSPPDGGLDDPYGKRLPQDDLSVKKIVLNNLYGEIIPRIRQAENGADGEPLVLNALQKSIQDCWPDEEGISRIVSQGSNTNLRKTLILLFLATDGGDSVYADWQESREDIFEDRWQRLEAMLRDCGYGMLDPREPFDWIALFCLCDQEGFIADKKMRRFLSDLFTGETEEDEDPE